MAVEAVYLESFQTSIVLRAAVLAIVTSWILYSKRQSGRSTWSFYKSYANSYLVQGLIPSALALLWLRFVNSAAPDPYLDEFFHVPQARTYCRGKFLEWDDKITTPPGLYIASFIWAQLLGECSTGNLRLFNVLILGRISVFVSICRSKIENARRGKQDQSTYAVHSAVNIGLFPVLFFFSGLFYTDVLSTLTVVLAYSNHLDRIQSSSSGTSFGNDLYTVVVGVVALFMRQTNVFWVVVYMGGLEAVQVIRDLRAKEAAPPSELLSRQPKDAVFQYSLGAVHDPPLEQAWPDDIVVCLLSIGIAAVGNFTTILRRIYPHITIMVLFAAFVAWNGGVVLGDKSNHVATLHLAQLLYIWPLFAFFSAPLFLPQVFASLKYLRGLVPEMPAQGAAQPGVQSVNKKGETNFPFYSILLSTVTILVALGVALVIIKYNTIIHPFTIADNRHYMFYIFRYTILRGSLVRLALGPIYVLCAILAWTTVYRLETSSPTVTNSNPEKCKSSITTTNTSTPTSTMVMLLVATTLSLMTAPLVEPRYFILPWIFWRLLVPQRSNKRRGLDPTLLLETVWFLLINAATCYIFLSRPFIWRAEDGTVLDGGRTQRFMW